MSRLASLIDQLAPNEGVTICPGIKEINFIRISGPVKAEPYIYGCTIAVIAQGKKIAYFGDEVLQYNPDNYLVLSTPMPLKCETIASPEEPLLGMTIDINLMVLNELISLMKDPFCPKKDAKVHPRGVQSIPLNKTLSAALERLLTMLQDPQDSKVLARGILREILYYILREKKAYSLFAITEHNSNFSRIARVLRNIHENYSRKITIEEMANEAMMSVASFHREFKKVTADSAIQYLKKYRLTKAKNLIEREQFNANQAAYKVGYESISQFSREFKRLFGEPPSFFSKK
jgi:AraC-like DNA-binding protein